jgi:hypothetical protein
MQSIRSALFLVVLLVVLKPAWADPDSRVTWQELAPGLSLGSFQARTPTPVGDGVIQVLRLDPEQWQPILVCSTDTQGHPSLTARQWSGQLDLPIVTNAGMFAQDHSTHLGYLRARKHVNSDHTNKYQSVAAFNPLDPENSPPFRIFDLDAPGVEMAGIKQQYASLVQNLRLIKAPGENRWKQQDRMWSEMALGQDDQGHVLLVFSRSPFSMHDFNAELLGAGLGLVALQHLEGGPEAQLFINLPGQEREFFGSYETDFNENDDNEHAWRIPNVLGFRRVVP